MPEWEILYCITVSVEWATIIYGTEASISAKFNWSYDWMKVPQLEETKIDHFIQIQHQYVWHGHDDSHKERHLIPTLKYGSGSVMFWGRLISRDPWALGMINGQIDFTIRDIFAKNLLPLVEG